MWMLDQLSHTKIGNSQVADNNVRGGRWVVRCHGYMPACLMAGLSQLPNSVSLHWNVGARKLNQR